MYNLTLLRHAQSIGNVNRHIQGQIDSELTGEGIKQVHALVSYWRSNETTFDKIIASPLVRTKKTAEIIADTFDIPIEFNANWMERNFGDFEGLSFEEIVQRHPDVDFFNPHQPVGSAGESLLELHSRASKAFFELLINPPGSYLIVAHGAILNMALYTIFGLDPDRFRGGPRFYFGNTSYAEITYDQTNSLWKLVSFNNSKHLSAN